MLQSWEQKLVKGKEKVSCEIMDFLFNKNAIDATGKMFRVGRMIHYFPLCVRVYC